MAPDDEMGAWGRFEFRAVIRKAHYTLAQRGAFWSLWCLAGLEDRAGRLKRSSALAAVGERALTFLIGEGDVVEVDDREVRISGWTTYQEPLERIREQNRERQAARRRRLAEEAAEAAGVTERDPTVTPRDERVTLSSHSLSSSSSPTVELEEALPAREADTDSWGQAALEVERLTGRPWGYTAGSRAVETLRYDVRDFGLDRVMGALQAVTKANGKIPDAAAIVVAAHRLLVPIPDTGKARAAEAEAERQAAFDRRVAATRKRNAELQAGS